MEENLTRNHDEHAAGEVADLEGAAAAGTRTGTRARGRRARSGGRRKLARDQRFRESPDGIALQYLSRG